MLVTLLGHSTTVVGNEPNESRVVIDHTTNPVDDTTYEALHVDRAISLRAHFVTFFIQWRFQADVIIL
jgi:hypothetical protein